MNYFEPYFGIPLNEWLVAAAIAAGMFFLIRTIRWLVIGPLSRLVKRTDTIVDDILIDVVSKTKSFFVVLVSVYAGSRYLDLPDTAATALRTIAVLSAILQCGLWTTGAVAFAVRKRMSDDPSSATALSALAFLSKLVIWSLALLLTLDNLDVDITALITGLGIGGIAVALALQNVLGDLFSSLSIVLDKPFVIGDAIGVNEFVGTVEHVGLKTTRVRSVSGEQIVFPNSDLLGSRIRNFKRLEERRVIFTLGVTYQTPAAKVEAIPAMIRSIIEGHPQTRCDRVHFKEYGESSLIFEVVYFVLSPDFNTMMDVRQTINLAIFRKFETEGISFAYPTQTLYLEKTGEG
jgi:small-conductance mechanosensitive channel